MNSSNIDDIWDEPVAHQDEVEAPTRSKRPLFLVESDDDDDDQAPRRVARKPPPQQDIDIDALFQDVDEEEFTSLPPALDIEAVRRRAEARHKQAAPSLTPHEILPSSSPPRDTGDRREEGKTKGKDKEGDQKKERRRPAQLNEGRLLGPSGFPQLIKDVKNFRIKGKGHEATDLNRLLQVYQFWTHSLYPKTPFRDTVERVEKLCHSRRMNVSLSVWRDEAHGITKARANTEDDMDDDDVTRKAPPSEDELHPGQPASPIFSQTSSPMPSRPPSSASEYDLHDDDIEALIREESALSREKPPAPMEDDEESFWSTVDDYQPPRLSQPAPQATPMDEDHDMWDLVREIEMNTSTSQDEASSIPKASTTEEDWDGSIYV